MYEVASSDFPPCGHQFWKMSAVKAKLNCPTTTPNPTLIWSVRAPGCLTPSGHWAEAHELVSLAEYICYPNDVSNSPACHSSNLSQAIQVRALELGN